MRVHRAWLPCLARAGARRRGCATCAPNAEAGSQEDSRPNAGKSHGYHQHRPHHPS
jgi:hypothetical protein